MKWEYELNNPPGAKYVIIVSHTYTTGINGYYMQILHYTKFSEYLNI